jgi:predicted permease
MTDLRMAVRHLMKRPGFSSVALLSLAIGIGANTAIFSLVNAFLLRPLPVRNPQELVLLRNVDGAGGRMSRSGENNGSIDPITGRAASTSFSLLSFERMRASHAPLSDLFAFAPFSQVNVLVDGQPEIAVTALMVSGNYHSGLGVSPALDRTLSGDDDETSATPVAVISFRYWARRFGRRADVLGQTIAINRVPTTIVGVTAQGFDGTMQAGESPDVTVPLAHYLRFQPDRRGRAQPFYWWLRVMGRLAPGATPAQAAAVLEPPFQEAAREGWVAGKPAASADERMPDVPTLVADPGERGENDVRRQFAASLQTLMGLVSLLLAAACANVANLLLARATARRREIAVCLAIGASRARIVRQLLTESLVLAAAGAVLGLALAWWARDLLLALRPFGNTKVVLDLPLDGRVLAFTIAATLGTALLFGLWPALRATGVDLNAEFQSGGRTLGGGRSRLGRGVMVVQIALSLVLLISTGLFVRTLGNLQHVDPGFNRQGLILFRIDAASAGSAPGQFTTLHARLQEALERLPGVRAATFSRVYFPALQQVDGNANFAVRIGGPNQNAGPLMPAIRSAVRGIDPALPVLDLRTQDEQIDRLHGQELLFAKLSGFFGSIARSRWLASASTGCCRTPVLRRTGEIGLRMALGALPGHVLRTVLGECLVLVGVGILVGVAAAFGAGLLISSMLFGVTPADPFTYCVVAVTLVVVALLAAFGPARRASRLDPVVALKVE